MAASLFVLAGCVENISETVNTNHVYTSTLATIAASKTEIKPHAPTNRELFQAYAQNMPVVEAGAYESYYGPFEWSGYFDSTDGSWSAYIVSATTAPFDIKSGILSTVIADFDNDGQDEMLIISKEGMHNINKEEEENYIMALDVMYESLAEVSASMYEVIEGKVFETAAHKLDIFPVTNVSYGNMDIFLIESGGLLHIIYEQSQLSAHTADGLSWVFKSLTYTDNKIDVNEQTSLADFGGFEHVFINGGIEAINEKIQTVGLQGTISSAPYERRLIDANDNAVPVLYINNWSFYHKEDEAFGADTVQRLSDSAFRLEPFVLLINDYSDTAELLNTGPRDGLTYSSEEVISKAEVDATVLSDKEKYMNSMLMADLKLKALYRPSFQDNASDEAFMAAAEDTFITWDEEHTRIFFLWAERRPREVFGEHNDLRIIQMEMMQRAASDDDPYWSAKIRTLYDDLIQYTMERTLEIIDAYFE